MLQDVGSQSADLALRTTYNAFARGNGFVQFLRGTGTYYQTFYSKGDGRVTVSDDRRAADLPFSGAPVHTEAGLQVAVGFFLAAGRLFGITSIAGTAHRGADGAHVNLSWQRRRACWCARSRWYAGPEAQRGVRTPAPSRGG